MDEEAIFTKALEMKGADQRSAYLDEACAGRADVRLEIEGLLSAYVRSGDFLDRAADAWNARLPMSLDGQSIAQPGTVIGPYKLMEQIGEGGMGLVFIAEQQIPVRRKVALKLIKPGMDSKQVIARFEAERQALAMMDHPNIAKVHDGGVTSEGRPYFVMELVKGLPITDYCDKSRLGTRQRLELFLDVCHAVQHAHQKGIIHRDLKPSNILVEVHDVRPLVKIIDFGISKAIGQRLTDKTLYTGMAHMVGTPMYMSPEQAGLSSLDVDTRSDVYSLGVLLYELLTGTTPFESEALKKAGYDEMRRIIREEEPPKPSTRVSTLQEAALSTIAEQRGLEPRRLTVDFRGELDWIVMRSLEKDRDRRYETASAFAVDIERYLNDEQVQACPPSAGYRLRKFARRHRVALATSGLVATALLFGTAVSVWQAIEATDARQLADERLDNEKQARANEERERKVANERRQQAEATANLLESVFKNLNPGEEKNDGLDLKQRLIAHLGEVADELEHEATDPLTQARLQHVLGSAFNSLGEANKAVIQFQRSLKKRQEKVGPDHADTLGSMSELAEAYHQAGKLDLALPLFEQTLEKMKVTLGPDHPDTLNCMSGLASAYQDAGKLDLALSLHKETLEKRKVKLGPDHLDTLINVHNLACAYLHASKPDLALPLIEETLEKWKAKCGPDHRNTLMTMNLLGEAYQQVGKPDLAEPLYVQLLEKFNAKCGPDHPETLMAMGNLAAAYWAGGKLDLALPLNEQTLEKTKLKLGPDHPTTLLSMTILGATYRRAGKLDLALPLLEQALEKTKTKLGPDHSWTLQSMHNLAAAYQDAGKLDQADLLFREMLERERKKERPSASATANALAELGGNLLKERRYVQAEPLLREGLAICEKQLPDDWQRFQMLSLLGDALLGQQKHADAEPLLLEGYEGLKTREAKIPADQKIRLTNAIERMVRFYEATEQAAKARAWREKLLEKAHE
jgi:serine/threonine protein kinase